MKPVPENSPLLRLLLFSFLPLLLGALVLVRLVPEFVLGIVHCPLRETTGIPCPTCGGTISLTHLAAGDWGQALRANPLVVLATAVYIPLAVYAAAATVVPRWRRSLRPSAIEKRTARWLAILLVILNWAWLVQRYLWR